MSVGRTEAMTAHVDTFETSVDSDNWPASYARTVPVNAVARVVEWWHGRRPHSLTMSEEWLQEYRRSSRSY
jgi:hypothetical protein